MGSLIASANNAATAAVASSSLVSSALTLSNKLSGGLNQLTPLSASINQVSASLSGKSPKRNARHKRLNEMRNSSSMSPKKSPNRTAGPTTAGVVTGLLGATAPSTSTSMLGAAQQSPLLPTASAPPTIPSLTPASNLSSYQHMPDKFRVYRTNNERDVSESDDDDMSDISGSPCSSCSGFSVSGSGSDYDSSDDDDDDEEDEDEDDEKSDAEVEENSTRDRPDIEMNDSTTIGADDQANNGQAMSCSGESDVGNVDADSDTQTRSITRRTPTPLDKRVRNTMRSKQKKRLVANQTPTDSSPTPAVNNTTPATNTAAKTATRSSNKQRNATPTPNNVNNIKTRKSHNNVATTVSTNVSSNNNGKTKMNNAAETTNSTTTTQLLLKPPLEPLQLVWAKCRGYPWYPALILDPKTPKGFVYNGVPLPAPPTDVLALRKNYPNDMEVFLVLFFDAKRTWQWLPDNKLEVLGIDKELDQQKLVESRKPTERKAVKKAYQDALHYQSQVSDLEGQGPDPIM